METVADRLKVEHKDVSRLIVMKAVSESLEKELAKVELSEKVSLLQELKLMLSQDSSSTGKSESIRAKLRPFLKDKNVTDEVLKQQMSVAASAESERNKKLRSQSKGRPSVSVVREDVTQPSSQTKPLQDDLLAAISAIERRNSQAKEHQKRREKGTIALSGMQR